MAETHTNSEAVEAHAVRVLFVEQMNCLVKNGVTVDGCAAGIQMAMMDIARLIAGPVRAIEWLRTVADYAEADLIATMPGVNF
jgi:hypothetical protein